MFDLNETYMEILDRRKKITWSPPLPVNQELAYYRRGEGWLPSSYPVDIDSASLSFRFEGYVVLSKFDRYGKNVEFHCYMGKKDNYDNQGHYDNSDGSLIYITDRERVADLLSATGYTLSQQEMLDRGIFTEGDYAEYDRLSKTTLRQFGEEKPLYFNVKAGGEAEPFSYPLKEQGAEEEKQAVFFRRRGR